MTVTPKTGIKENEQLAFIRACAVKEFLNNHIAAIKDMNTEYSHHFRYKLQYLMSFSLRFVHGSVILANAACP
jgi:hypothetical protein